MPSIFIAYGILFDMSLMPLQPSDPAMHARCALEPCFDDIEKTDAILRCIDADQMPILRTLAMNRPRSPKVAALTVLTLGIFLSGCAPYQALTMEYYKAPTNVASGQLATITGSNDEYVDLNRPITVFVSAIDGQLVGLPKTARCNVDKHYQLSPGGHDIHVWYYIGLSYTRSQEAKGIIIADLEPGVRYVVKGGYREGMALVWIETQSGKKVSHVREIPLKDNPGKNMPIGFAAMSDSCILP